MTVPMSAEQLEALRGELDIIAKNLARSLAAPLLAASRARLLQVLPDPAQRMAYERARAALDGNPDAVLPDELIDLVLKVEGDPEMARLHGEILGVVGRAISWVYDAAAAEVAARTIAHLETVAQERGGVLEWRSK